MIGIELAVVEALVEDRWKPTHWLVPAVIDNLNMEYRHLFLRCEIVLQVLLYGTSTLIKLVLSQKVLLQEE